MKKLALLLLLAGPAYAAQQCVTLDGSSFTQDQINLSVALAYELGFAQNNATQAPTVTQNGTQVTYCFQDPTFNVATVITVQNLKAQYQTDQAGRDAAKVIEDGWKLELSTTAAAASSAWTNWATLTAGQKDTAAKSMVRIIDLMFNKLKTQ